MPRDGLNAFYPYSKNQLETLRAPKLPVRQTRPATTPRGRMLVYFVDGTTELIGADELKLRKANQWSGWICNAGLEVLKVDKGGNVYRGVCREGGSLGTVWDEDIQLPLTPITCRKKSCNCSADIMVARDKPRT